MIDSSKVPKQNKVIALFFSALLYVFAQASYAAIIGEHLWQVNEGLQQPSAVAVADDGRVFLLDGTNQKVHAYSEGGKLLQSFRALPKDAPAHHLTTDIHLSDNKLYIADPIGHRVIVLSLQGELLNTIPLQTEKGQATPVAILLIRNRLFWSDQKEHRLCRKDLNKKQHTVRCWGGLGQKKEQFYYPYMMAMDGDDSVMVVDVLNARIQRFKWNGYHYGEYGRFGNKEYELYRPNGITTDSSGTAYITDSYRGTVSLYKNLLPQGDIRNPAGDVWRFKAPVGITHSKNRLYIVDAASSTLTAIQLSDDGTAAKIRSEDARPSYSKRSCLTCHLSWSPDYRATESKEAVLPVSTEKMCYSCHHGAVIESRLTIGQGHQHPSLPQDKKESDNKKDDENKDEIPEEYPLVQDGRLYCGSCHTPHAKDESGKPNREDYSNPWLRQANTNARLCRQCHPSYETSWKNEALPNAKKNHPVDISMTPPPHNKAKGYPKDTELQEGMPTSLQQAGGRLSSDEQILCQSCHQMHGAADDALVVINNQASELCTSCHQRLITKDKEEARQKGIHPVNFKLEEPIKFNGKLIKELSCGSCHAAHAAEPGSALLPVSFNSDTLCQGCHENQHAKDEKDSRKKGIHPINIEMEEPVKLAGREIKQVKCLSCHAVHSGVANTPSLLAEHRDGTLCKACHTRHYAEDKKEAHKKGVHPINIKLEEPVKLADNEIKELNCISCHSTHAGKPDTPTLVVTAENGEMCNACHERQKADNLDDARLKGVHPVNMELDEAIKIADSEIKKLACGSCHKLHKGAKNSAAVIESDQDGTLCKNCHKNEAEITNSDHDLVKGQPDKQNLLEQPHLQAGICGSCHSMHKNEKKRAFLFVGSKEQTITESETTTIRDGLCLACHQKKGYAEEKIIEHNSHPYKDIILQAPIDDMPLLDEQNKISEFGRIGCITCHDPHRWTTAKSDNQTKTDKAENEEGNVLTSFLRKAKIGGSFCVDCHGLDARIMYKYFHDKLGRQKQLDYIK